MPTKSITEEHKNRASNVKKYEADDSEDGYDNYIEVRGKNKELNISNVEDKRVSIDA